MEAVGSHDRNRGDHGHYPCAFDPPRSLAAHQRNDHVGVVGAGRELASAPARRLRRRGRRLLLGGHADPGSGGGARTPAAEGGGHRSQAPGAHPSAGVGALGGGSDRRRPRPLVQHRATAAPGVGAGGGGGRRRVGAVGDYGEPVLRPGDPDPARTQPPGRDRRSVCFRAASWIRGNGADGPGERAGARILGRAGPGARGLGAVGAPHRRRGSLPARAARRLRPLRRYGALSAAARSVVMARLSGSRQDYLKALYALAPQGEVVPTSRLAAHLSVSAPSVTNMLRRLAEEKLVLHKPRGGARLTARGRREAILMVRRHRILETFL